MKEQIIAKLSVKIKFHKKNYENARKCDKCFTFAQVFISSSMTLAMVTLSALDITGTSSLIAGAVFSFVVGVITKIKDTNEYQIVYLENKYAYENYQKLLNQSELGQINDQNLEIQFNFLEEKYDHLQRVRFCFFF